MTFRDDVKPLVMGVPEGTPFVCDACNVQLTDNRKIAIADSYQTSWGLVCVKCYDETFRPDIEDVKSPDHGAVRLIRAWKTGEDLHPISEDPTAGTMTAVLLCPHCNVISLIDLGNISTKQANERTQRCPACGREVKA